MGSGVSMGNSGNRQRASMRGKSQQAETEAEKDNFSYYFANDGIKFTKTPLAYRDADGKIKLYADGTAPTILVPTDNVPTKTTDGIDSGEDDIDGRKSLHSLDDSTDSLSVAPDYDCPKPPVIKRRDLIPDDEVFRLIDEHSMRAPPDIKEDFFKLVDYLTEVTCSPLEHVRAFYIWITHNINYDTSGFFGWNDLMPTDPTSVLKNRVAVCRGFTELMEAFCSLVNIPVKTIYGYVKAYGYQPGTDVSLDRFNAHAWNAVFIENEWRLLDVTWGAGFVKTRERVYVPRFNDVYFLTDPAVFITDHFPHDKEDPKYGEKWQLLENPLDKKVFDEILNMDKHGKEWGIEAISHKKAVIHDVHFEIDIVFAETYTRLSDYVAFLFMDGTKLAHYTYIYRFGGKSVNIHASFPVLGEIVLQLYGRRADHDITTDLHPLLKYTLRVTKCYEVLSPYPVTYTPYGAVEDLESFGISDVGNLHHVTSTGEATVSVKPSRDVDLIPRLHFGDHNEDLKRFVLVNYSADFENINFHVRMPFKGNFRLSLLGQNNDSVSTCKSFMTCLLENKENVSDDVFPAALAHSVKYKCCLVAPLKKVVPSSSEILFHVKSPFLAMVRVAETILDRTDEMTFSGEIKSPGAYSDLKVYGAEEFDGAWHPLYIFNTA